MPTFSVILTTRDRQPLLDEAIASVLAQTVSDFELIVVDDASTVPACVPEDPRIRCVRHEENRGLAGARNTGLAEATGEYVTFLDDDDVLDPRRLELAHEGLRAAPIALCWFRYFGEEPSGRILNGVVADEILNTTTPSMGATAIRREVAQEFDTRYRGSQDVEWWIRMSAHEVSTVPTVGYWVRKHDGLRAGNGTVARIDGSRLMLEEHADFFAAHPTAAAFRWKRIGIMEAKLGRRAAATRAFARSMRIRPHPATVGTMARSLVRSYQA